MANEYLKRTPTSTGNRKVWSLAFWLKKPSKVTQNPIFNGANTAAGSHGLLWRYQSGGPFDIFEYNSSSTTWQLATAQPFRDDSSWYNILLSVDTTKSTSSERVKLYFNGILITNFTTAVYPSQNYEGYVNSTVAHYFNAQQFAGTINKYGDGQYFDVFFVDGQALTPDVFGYYKKGDGYISAGSTQSTDFKKGQWVPKAPKVIKSVINARGGFGVNGFYLPMNDGTNVGADLHCTPNSIITLKGEDEPQPYYGAPTTTDAYVSQLRSDPYKDYLVFAMPGISTSTSANLVTDGNFYTGVSNWTADANATLTHNEGAMRITVTATAGARQSITVVDGERYILSFKVRTDGTNFSNFQLNHSGGTSDYFGVNISNTDWRTYSISFVADGTSVELRPYKATSGWVEYDDIVVKQQGVPRDYSADIKGSGTNKTIALSPGTYVDSGFALDIPGYYGSAVSLNDDATQGLLLGWGEGDPDYDFGTGDFTMEAWVYPSVQDAGYWSILRSRRYSGADGSGLALYGYQNVFRMWERTSSTSGAVNIHGGDVGSAPTGQWTHIALVRHNGRILSFCNGVCVGNNANIVDYENNGFEIGQTFPWQGYIQDVRIYKGIAKYKNGFDIVKPYTPVGIATWRAVPDCTANNFATWNPLFNGIGNLAITDGNLTLTESSSSTSQMTGTIEVSSGKWYYESYVGANPFNGSVLLGIGPATRPATNIQNRTVYRSNGDVYTDSGTTAQSGTTYTTGNIIGIAFDVDAKKLWFSKNGSWVYSGDPSTGSNTAVTLTLDSYSPFTAFDGGVGTAIIKSNFGQNPTFSGNTTAGTFTDSNGKGLFKYQPPSGFLALCEDNLPTPAIANPGEHFKTVLYTGDGNSGRSITGVGFQPDFVWIKRRASGNQAHALHDSVRGPSVHLETSTTDGDETNNVYGALNSFDTDGFSLSLGSGGGGDYVNSNNNTYVAWCWKAGGNSNTFNVDGTGYATASAAGITDGSIALTGASVNTTAGFSIATWTGNGQNTQTIGHGLGKAPDFYIWKSRDNAREWHISHKSLTAYNYTLYFTTAGQFNNDKIYQAPDSSVIYPENSNTIIGLNENYIGYFWTEIEGFSKFGSYVGNGNADGPFVYCGFKPAWLLIKSTAAGDSWYMTDSSRNSINGISPFLTLRAESSNMEALGPGDPIDLLSNGFKMRGGGTAVNANGTKYIFAAFAESPFTTANAK